MITYSTLFFPKFNLIIFGDFSTNSFTLSKPYSLLLLRSNASSCKKKKQCNTQYNNKQNKELHRSYDHSMSTKESRTSVYHGRPPYILSMFQLVL